MLSLTKRVDYALISLAYMVEHRRHVCSARAIAQTHDLKLPQLMNVLKAMHQHGILCSRRGASGGYQISARLEDTSLHDLLEALHDERLRHRAAAPRLSDQAPLRALQYKLMQFLRQVKLSDLVLPGRRIDVPVELITTRRCRCEQPMWPVGSVT